MDYRSTIADDEHPAGPSPWGSSSPSASPRRSQSTFSSVGNEPPPPMPYQYAAQDSSNGFAHEDPGVNAFRRPGTAGSTASTTAYDPPEHPAPSEQSDVTHEPHQHQAGVLPQSQVQGQPSGGHPSGQDQQAQQAQRPKGPQYKLQAKITGLERTGRKDPILRFDVHVSLKPR